MWVTWNYTAARVPHLTLTGGSGYTSAPTAAVTITSGDSTYPDGTTNYTCTVNVATPVSGAVIQSRVLMDGNPVMGVYQATTDSTGNALTTATQLIVPTAGTHSFEVQALTLSTAAVTTVTPNFTFIEMG